MSQVRKTIQVGRNVSTKIILERAFEVMYNEPAELEFWCITELAPEVRDVFPPSGDTRISIGLTTLQRNISTTLFPDHVMTTLDSGTSIKIPYDAIYCVVTDAALARKLKWMTEKGVAFVNLVDDNHGLQKWS